MNLQPTIRTASARKLIGKSMRMSIFNNKTTELWQGFMKERKLIKNGISDDLFSVQVYDAQLKFNEFTINTEFVKFAGEEVSCFTEVPFGMETLVIPEGLYAVFLYKGRPQDFSDTFKYIFYTWLPRSGYTLDPRPHFEILSEKYKNNDPSSEEEVWIPVRKNKQGKP